MWNLKFLPDLLVVRWRGFKYLAFFVMRQRMMFYELICQFLVARPPIYIKLALFNSVFDPIKSHVHGFCAFLSYCAIDVSCGGGIVSFHWCGGLFVPQFLNVVLRTDPSLALIKTSPISASAAAKDMTSLRTLLIIKIAPLVSCFDVLLCFPCKRILQPCFFLHLLRDMMHHCECVESCQMSDTVFLIQGECCTN
jgi:hypothetical protein